MEATDFDDEDALVVVVPVELELDVTNSLDLGRDTCESRDRRGVGVCNPAELRDEGFLVLLESDNPVSEIGNALGPSCIGIGSGVVGDEVPAHGRLGVTVMVVGCGGGWWNRGCQR